MRHWDVVDWMFGIFFAFIALVVLFMICMIPFVIKESQEFRARCEAKQGVVITGRDIRLCIVDGKIVDGN